MSVFDESLKIPERAQVLIQEMGGWFDIISDAPHLSEVRAGCDCGCGGDTVDFDSAYEDYNDAVLRVEELYDQLVVELRGQ